MRRLVLLVACATLIAPAAAFAEGDVAPSTTPAAKPVKEKKVCKAQEETGSRLGRKSTCRTKAERDDISHRQRMEIERKINIAPSTPQG
jgi:hypothetical protein